MSTDGDWGGAAWDIQVLTGLEAVRKRPNMYVGDRMDALLATRLAWQCLIYAVGAESARIDVTQTGVAVVLYRGMGLARVGPPCPGFRNGEVGTPALRRELTGPESLTLLESIPGPGPAELWPYDGTSGDLMTVVALSRVFEARVSDSEGQFTAMYRNGVCVEPVAKLSGPVVGPFWTEFTFQLDAELVPSASSPFDAAWLRSEAASVPFPVEVVS